MEHLSIADLEKELEECKLGLCAEVKQNIATETSRMRNLEEQIIEFRHLINQKTTLTERHAVLRDKWLSNFYGLRYRDDSYNFPLLIEMEKIWKEIERIKVELEKPIETVWKDIKESKKSLTAAEKEIETIWKDIRLLENLMNLHTCSDEESDHDEYNLDFNS